MTVAALTLNAQQDVNRGRAIGEVRLRDAANRDVQGGGVIVSAIDGYEFLAAKRESRKAWAAGGNRTTKGDGKFLFPRLPAGAWYFYAYKRGFTSANSTETTVNSDKTSEAKPKPIVIGPEEISALNKTVALRSRRSPFILVLSQSALPPSAQPPDEFLVATRVVDSGGKPVPDAVAGAFYYESTALNATDGSSTNAAGLFSLRLPPRQSTTATEYLLVVSKKGYQPRLYVRRRAPGPQPDVVLLTDEESEDTSLLEAAEGTRRIIVHERTIASLPFVGFRSFDELALLAPGVVPAPQSPAVDGPSFVRGIGSAGQFVSNGIRSRENDYAIDGAEDNDGVFGVRRQGYIVPSPQSLEGVQEFQVITFLPDSRFGRNIGAHVNILTKSGAEFLRGQIYGFYTRQSLRARDYFTGLAANLPASIRAIGSLRDDPVFVDGWQLFTANPTVRDPTFDRSQSGFVLGGPFPFARHKAKNWYLFGSYEFLRLDEVKEQHSAVPLAEQRGFEGSAPSGLYRGSLAGDAVFSLFPFPNNPLGPYGRNTFTSTGVTNGTGNRFTIKADYRFGYDRPASEPKSTLAFAYSFAKENVSVPSIAGALNSSITPETRPQDFTLYNNFTKGPNYSHTFRFAIGHTRAQLQRSPSNVSSYLIDSPLLLNNTLATNANPSRFDFTSANSSVGESLLSGLYGSRVSNSSDITGPITQLIIGGYSPVGLDPVNYPQIRKNLTVQLGYTGTLVRGTNAGVLGYDFRGYRFDTISVQAYRPALIFGGLMRNSTDSTLPLTALNNSVLSSVDLAAAGIPTGAFQSFESLHMGQVSASQAVILNLFQNSVFWQVEQHPTSSLSVTYGSRLEFNSISDPTTAAMPQPAPLFDRNVLVGDATEAQAQCGARCPGLLNDIENVFPLNYGDLAKGDRINLGSKLGFAWNPKRASAWVLRGGFGLQSGQVPALAVNDARNRFNRFFPLNVANSSALTNAGTFLFNLANPTLRAADPALASIQPGVLEAISGNPWLLLSQSSIIGQRLGAGGSPFEITLVRPAGDLKNPVSLHYGLTLEREIGGNVLALSFAGTRGVRLLRLNTPDGGALRSDIRFQGLSTLGVGFPEVMATMGTQRAILLGGTIPLSQSLFEGTSSSTYNSLQLELRRRFHKGLQASISTTWAHAIDDASDVFDLASTFSLPQNSSERSERASSSFDIRWRTVGTFVWDIFPRRWVAVGGLQMSGLAIWQTALPFTVNTSIDVNGDGNLTDRLNTLNGLLIGPVRGDRTVAIRLNAGVQPNQLLAPPGNDGVIGRNTFRGFGLFNSDIAISKSFRTDDQERVNLRLEAFNVLNHANFGVPVRILEFPSFGRSTDTINPPRTLQLSVKLIF